MTGEIAAITGGFVIVFTLIAGAFYTERLSHERILTAMEKGCAVIETKISCAQSYQLMKVSK